MTSLEDLVQLHEKIEIIYVVDKYIATLYTEEGDVQVEFASGESIRLAIDALEEKLEGRTLKDIRGKDE